MTPSRRSPKSEALEALEQARDILKRPALVPLEVVHLRALVQHVTDLVREIQEARRRRRVREAPPPSSSPPPQMALDGRPVDAEMPPPP